jgi:hypothetical protein
MSNWKKIIKILLTKLLNKYKKKPIEKVEIKKDMNFLEPVESSIAVKLLKKKFMKHEDQESSIILTKGSDLYTDLLHYINSLKESGIFPASTDIEDNFGINKRKRQELLKKAYDDGHIVKINPTTYGFKEVLND